MHIISLLAFFGVAISAFFAPLPSPPLITCDTKPYTRIRGSHTFHLSVPENAHAVKVEIYVNSILKATNTTAPFNVTLDASPYFSEGEIQFVAYDAADKETASLRLPVFLDVAPDTARIPTMDSLGKTFPELETLSWGFAAQDIASVDEKYLKDGFVILNNSAGKPIYELPIRFTANRIQSCTLSSGFVYTTYFASDNQYFLVGAVRPTGLVDATLPLSALDQYKGDLDDFVARLPDAFLPQIVKKNVAAKFAKIRAKQESGEYLSPSDAQADVLDAKRYTCDTLNSALVACKTLVFEEQFQFERPLVQTRNLVRIAGAGTGSSPTREKLNAIRLLNANGLLTKLHSTAYSNAVRSLEAYPWVWVTYGSSQGAVSGVAIPPFPTQDRIRSIGFSKIPVYGGQVQSNGSLRWGALDPKSYRP